MLQGIIITALQSWESTLLFDAFMPRKVSRRFFIAYILFYGILFGFFYNLLFPTPSVLSILFSLLMFTSINYALYSDTLFNRLLIVLGWYALLVSTEGTVVSFLLEVLTSSCILASSLLSSLSFSISALFIEFIVLFTFSRIIRHLNHPKNSNVYIKRQSVCILILYLFSTSASLVIALLLMGNIQLPISLASFCLSFVVIFSILFVKRNQYITQIQKESLALNEKLSSETENIEILSQAYAKQRKMTHEYNSHLLTLNILAQENDIEQIKSYLNELLQIQSERILFVNTHHSVLDAIFNQKAIIAQKNHIDLQFHFNDLHNVEISSCDLSVIIGNLMNNAIESSLNLPESDRFIEVSVLLEQTFMFSIRNRSTPVTIIDDRISTTKKPFELHGFGLRNIESILAYYPSSYHTMEYTDGWFYYTFEMPNIPRSFH